MQMYRFLAQICTFLALFAHGGTEKTANGPKSPNPKKTKNTKKNTSVWTKKTVFSPVFFVPKFDANLQSFWSVRPGSVP